MLHWQTTSFARHKAYDEAQESIAELTDSFLEVFQGKKGRIYFEGAQSINVHNINSDELESYLDDCIDTLSNDVTALLDQKDTDLLNIRDVFLSTLNKLKYLLTLE